MLLWRTCYTGAWECSAGEQASRRGRRPAPTRGPGARRAQAPLCCSQLLGRWPLALLAGLGRCPDILLTVWEKLSQMLAPPQTPSDGASASMSFLALR